MNLAFVIMMALQQMEGLLVLPYKNRANNNMILPLLKGCVLTSFPL